ncbi:MAG: beta-ketoacyl-ACP synthase II [Fimbriimonadaceae bacterium]|nr:beta-ketoacyl-ACP synthase II [Fimbriimonadaceae bacterium]
MSLRRVVITGMGMLSPLGHSLAESWAAGAAGRSGTGPLTRFDPGDLHSSVAAELKQWDAEAHFERKYLRRTDPFIQYALVAAREAVAQSGLQIDDSNRERVGTVFGSGIGGLQAWDDNYKLLRERGPNRVSPFLIPMLIGNMAAGMVAIEFGAQGPSKSVQTACATSAHSAGDALRLIQWGEADVMLTGGAEAPITPLACAGFASMKALTTRNHDPEHASRPFDAGRDGFVMGEGAGALVLEELEHARARGARIFAELVGYGQSTDAYHMAAPLPCGSGAARAMQLSLTEAGLTTADVDYINAHATSTHAGDIAEVHAVQQLYPDGNLPPVSATKSMTGHMLGAAGAVELIFCIQSINEGLLLPTINYTDPDPECLLDCVPNQARAAQVDVAICNSFGFGGHNCSLVVRRYEG